MEENKKNNGLVIAFVIVFIVAVIGIGGTIYFYNKSLNNNEINNNKETSSEKDTNEEEKLTIEQLKSRYEVDYSSSPMGQWGPIYNCIKDTQQNKIIIDNLKDMGQSSLYFIISNNKGYVYIEERGPEIAFGQAKLYDLNGNIIFDVITTKHFKFIKNNDFSYEYSPVYVEENIEGVYYYKNGVIGKYSLDGTLLSSSKKYDEVDVVGLKYSLIYNHTDKSSYVVSNEDSYSMKITDGRITDAYSVSYDENNKEIKIYYDYGNYYLLNLNNNQITKGSL